MRTKKEKIKKIKDELKEWQDMNNWKIEQLKKFAPNNELSMFELQHINNRLSYLLGLLDY